MTVSENKAVISSFLEEVLNQGRLERVDDLVAVDFVEVDPFPGQKQGREGLKQVISAFRTAFPDIHWVIEEMLGEGEKVFKPLYLAWHSPERILWRSCNGQADNGEGHGCRSRGGRQDGRESNPNGLPEHDETARCHSRLTGT
jgi:predicted SnoaL-like aldol condensation-catalyzing enzyme